MAHTLFALAVSAHRILQLEEVWQGDLLQAAAALRIALTYTISLELCVAQGYNIGGCEVHRRPLCCCCPSETLHEPNETSAV